MDGSTLDDLLSRRTESGADALYAPGDPGRRYDGARLFTDAKKTGNFLRQLGVGPRRTVAIADFPTPESVLALFGAALLGAPARFVSIHTSEVKVGEEERIDARVLIAPVDVASEHPVNVTKRIAYGGAPDDPETAYFERDVWSENPTFPPGGPSGNEIAIETGEEEHTHAEVVRAAERVVDEWGFDTGVEIAVRAPLCDPRTIVAGVLAPLSGGGVVLFPDEETQGDVAVVANEAEDAPEPRTIDVESVAFGDR